MLVSKKDSKKFLFIAFVYIAFGVIFSLFSLYESNEVYIEIIAAINLFLTAFGMYNLFRFFTCRQKDSYTIDIKNKTLYFNDKSFDLQESFLFFELKKCAKELIEVWLYQEKDAKIVTIFSKLLFSKEEFEKFLKLIKPYRKFDAFPWKSYKTKGAFYLCKDGFILNGREFFYEEVESIEWKNRYERLVSGTLIFVIVTIKLKNSQKIEEVFVKTDDFIYVKLTYIDIKIKSKEDILRVEGNPQMNLKFYELKEEIKRGGCGA